MIRVIVNKDTRHCERSEAIQSHARHPGLPRGFAPRNDDLRLGDLIEASPDDRLPPRSLACEIAVSRIRPDPHDEGIVVDPAIPGIAGRPLPTAGIETPVNALAIASGAVAIHQAFARCSFTRRSVRDRGRSLADSPGGGWWRGLRRNGGQNGQRAKQSRSGNADICMHGFFPSCPVPCCPRSILPNNGSGHELVDFGARQSPAFAARSAPLVRSQPNEGHRDLVEAY